MERGRHPSKPEFAKTEGVPPPGNCPVLPPTLPSLREKIEAARKKFKGLNGTASRPLVLYNNGKPLVFLTPGPEDDRPVRGHVGSELAKLEEEERAAGIRVDPWSW